MESNDSSQPTKRRSSPFALIGFFLPLVVAALGVLVGIASPHQDSDWFGASVLASTGIGLLLASTIAVACLAISLARRERAAFLAAITGIPALFFMIWLLSGLLRF
jgi:hypothetical protein